MLKAKAMPMGQAEDRGQCRGHAAFDDGTPQTARAARSAWSGGECGRRQGGRHLCVLWAASAALLLAALAVPAAGNMRVENEALRTSLLRTSAAAVQPPAAAMPALQEQGMTASQQAEMQAEQNMVAEQQRYVQEEEQKYGEAAAQALQEPASEGYAEPGEVAPAEEPAEYAEPAPAPAPVAEPWPASANLEGQPLVTTQTEEDAREEFPGDPVADLSHRHEMRMGALRKQMQVSPACARESEGQRCEGGMEGEAGREKRAVCGGEREGERACVYAYTRVSACAHFVTLWSVPRTHSHAHTHTHTHTHTQVAHTHTQVCFNLRIPSSAACPSGQSHRGRASLC